MVRQFLFSCALLSSLALQAQKGDKSAPYWLDPEVNRVNCEAPRAAFFAYENTDLERHQKRFKTLYVSGRRLAL